MWQKYAIRSLREPSYNKVEQYEQGHINRYVTSTEKASFEAAVIHTGC